ncbi:hypothetical protein [Chelativorans alearense]|uniref:hypothetical protein n=1 Tax=Chelativorans alearense TaxID=2681495 RepID=UPI0013D4745E|nr:hypothetical protein [Chelativorans alearense]
MERHRLCLKSAILAGVLAAVNAPAALALEAEDVGARLKGLMTKQQLELTYDGASMDGADVILEGVAVKSTAGETAVPIGDVTLRNVTEEADGALRADAVDVDDVTFEESGRTFRFSGFTMTGLILPENAGSKAIDGVMHYDQAGLARLEIEGKDGFAASFEDIRTEVAVADDDTMTFDGAMGSFLLDLRSVKDGARAIQTLKDMGYERITGSGSATGSWRPSDGRTTLSRYEVTADNAGTLSLMADFDGYTPEFIQAMEEMTKGGNAGGGENNTAQGMAMLGMMQQLTFHGLTLRFTDDSLTGRALDYAAKQQGGKPEDIIAQAKAVIPMQLTPYLGAELTQNLTQAVGTFLENPETLEISAKPENPVPFAMLMGAAMGAPELLIKQIGLMVTANE